MEVTGIVCTDVSERVTPTTQKRYYMMRVVEHQGSGPKRTSTWYEALMHVSGDVMATVKKNDLVRITGKIEAVPFERNGEPDARLRLIGFRLEVLPRHGNKTRPAASEPVTNAGESAAANDTGDVSVA